MSHIKNIEKFVPDLKGRKILDLGCGRGDDLIEFVKSGYSAVGMDVNEEYLNISAQKARESGLDIALCRGEAENLPFPDNSFDFINCSEVTEHAEDPEKLLAECWRALRRDGRMYITFANRFDIYDGHYHLWFINWMPRPFAEKVIKLIGKAKSEDGRAGRQKLSEMHYFTYGNILKLFKDSNFEYINTREEQVMNPDLSNRKILKIISVIGLSKFFAYFIKKFIGTFHFIAIKSDNKYHRQ